MKKIRWAHSRGDADDGTAIRKFGGDEVLGEFGAHEGIVIPRGAAYWFESVGDETLELLQVVAFDRDVKNERVDVEPPKFGTGTPQRFDGRTG